MSDENFWLQLSDLSGVAQRDIDRIAAYEGATVVRELGEGRRASYVLVEDALAFEQALGERDVTLVNGAEFRRFYGVSMTSAERVAAARAWGESRVAPYYRWPAVMALIAGTDSESERAALAEIANETMRDLEDDERYVQDNAMRAAIAGRPAAATAGDHFIVRSDRGEDVRAAKWLGEDPSRLPNIRSFNVFAPTIEEVIAIVRSLGARPIDFIKLPKFRATDVSALIEAIPTNVRGIDCFYCEYGVTLFESVAKAPVWPGLRVAKFHNNNGKTKGLKALIAGKDAASLESLGIGYNHLKSTDFAALAKAPWLSGLRALEMKYNNAYAKGASALFAKAKLPKLEALDFGANEIGDEGLQAIVANPTITALRALTIEGNSVDPLLGPPSGMALAQWPAARSLRALNLGQNEIGDEGFAAIVNSPMFEGLIDLDLQYNGITGEGLKAVAGSQSVVRPKRVVLSGNDLGSGKFGMKPRAPAKKLPPSGWDDAQWLSECETLVLYNTSLDPDSLASLVASPALKKLRALDVSSNYGLSNKALECVLNSAVAKRLVSLEAMYWDWTPGAADLLINAPFADSLLRLAVSKKGLSQRECIALRARYGNRIYLS